MDLDERRRRMEAEIERLQGQLESLEREWTRVPWLLASAALALPAFFVWGMLGAILALLGAISLVATAAYLIGVRKRETQGEIEHVRGDLERLSRGSR